MQDGACLLCLLPAVRTTSPNKMLCMQAKSNMLDTKASGLSAASAPLPVTVIKDGTNTAVAASESKHYSAAQVQPRTEHAAAASRHAEIAAQPLPEHTPDAATQHEQTGLEPILLQPSSMPSLPLDPTPLQQPLPGEPPLPDDSVLRSLPEEPIPEAGPRPQSGYMSSTPSLPEPEELPSAPDATANDPGLERRDSRHAPKATGNDEMPKAVDKGRVVKEIDSSHAGLPRKPPAAESRPKPDAPSHKRKRSDDISRHGAEPSGQLRDAGTDRPKQSSEKLSREIKPELRKHMGPSADREGAKSARQETPPPPPLGAPPFEITGPVSGEYRLIWCCLQVRSCSCHVHWQQ